jgi:undecaprenyl diphosphate synthase
LEREVPNKPTAEDKKVQEELRASGTIPAHIAIIMDGNGRWATRRSLPRVAGHQEGVSSVRDIVEACGQLGVGVLTLYAFSTENWNRPQEEVSMLMRLLLNSLRDETDRLHKNNVRLIAIGDIEKLPVEVQEKLAEAQLITKNNSGLILNLALSYSGRWEIEKAIKEIARKVQNGEITIDEITEATIAEHLTTAGIPEPDLLIRTGGEYRVSNFMLWQLAYAELYISKKFWPEFRRKHLYEAIVDFQHRERRFGLVSEQVRRRSNGGEKSLAAKIFESITGE